MKLFSVALVALFALAALASVVPSASAMPPLCQSDTVAVGTLEVVTIRHGAECGAYPITVYECTPKYGEAAPLHWDCTGTNL